MTRPQAPGAGYPTWVEVDLDRLEVNARWASMRAGTGRSVLAVVKSRGYGHGAVTAARAFLAGGVTSFGVFLVEAARDLRRGGIEGPILVMGPLHADQIGAALEARATRRVRKSKTS